MKTPSVLAFERKLDPSDALFAAGTWGAWDGDWEPVVVREKTVRGTISNRLSAKAPDPAKRNPSVENANLQTIDVASLPATCDTLRVRFSLRILGGVGRPSACNDREYQQKLLAAVAAYREETGFVKLARRYACNLANGRFLWRNRLAAEQVRVEVRHLVKGKEAGRWGFDAFALPMTDFALPEADRKALEELAEVIAGGLAEPTGGYRLLEVTAFARMGSGQEVFPSQEFISQHKETGTNKTSDNDKTSKDRKSEKETARKSKTLYAVNGVAGMHSQKIGNALRTIDTWYPGAGNPIAVEPYGSVTSLGTAYRQPKEKSDFYSLLDGWMLKDKTPEADDRHFVMATFIRGGVFGSSEKE